MESKRLLLLVESKPNRQRQHFYLFAHTNARFAVDTI